MGNPIQTDVHFVSLFSEWQIGSLPYPIENSLGERLWLPALCAGKAFAELLNAVRDRLIGECAFHVGKPLLPVFPGQGC